MVTTYMQTCTIINISNVSTILIFDILINRQLKKKGKITPYSS